MFNFFGGETIIEFGKYENIKRCNQGIEEIRNGSQLIIPGLVNAHSHGRGVLDFQQGNLDGTLETYLCRT